MPDVDVTDETTTAAVVTPSRPASAARSARLASNKAKDDYADLVSLPTPNRDMFGTRIMPGEIDYTGIGRTNSDILQHLIEFEVGGHPLSSTAHGIVYRVSSYLEKEEQRRKGENDDDDIPAGAYEPRISVLDTQHKSCMRSENFACDGTMLRHTHARWAFAPVEFKSRHNVTASNGSPVECISYEKKIEDLTPFDCDVYTNTVWEKCKSCHDADEEFVRWALRAATPEGQSVLHQRMASTNDKKRKAEEVAPASASEDVEEGGEGKIEAKKQNLKSG